MRRCCRVFLLLLMAIAFAGCEFLGPRALRAGRNEYNTAIQRTDLEELLLNIVRLRYTDNPYFLQVSSVTTSPDVGAEAGGNVEETGFGGNLSYGERPTIVYSPLTGEAFIRRLLKRVDMTTLRLLAGAGWELDDIFRVFVNRMNGIPNAPTGAGPTPEGVPEFHTFLETVEFFDELEDRSLIQFAAAGDSDSPDMVLMVDRENIPADLKQDQEAALRSLGLQSTDQYRMRIGVVRGEPDEIVLETRPLLGALFYLGQSIEIPEELLQSGVVNQNTAMDETPFDWNLVMKDLIRIRSSSSAPDNPFVSVRYGGFWYYIERADVDSKETLTMVNIVFTLQSGGAPVERPVLTIPVGSGS